MLSKVFIQLLESPEKPEHPIDFIRENLGALASVKEKLQIDFLKQEVDSYRHQVEELKKQLEEAQKQQNIDNEIVSSSSSKITEEADTSTLKDIVVTDVAADVSETTSDILNDSVIIESVEDIPAVESAADENLKNQKEIIKEDLVADDIKVDEAKNIPAATTTPVIPEITEKKDEIIKENIDIQPLKDIQIEMAPNDKQPESKTDAAPAPSQVLNKYAIFFF